MKRETTRWRFQVPYAGHGLIRVGYVFNCGVVPEDIIRVQIKNTAGTILDFRATLDEAATIAAGLTYAVGSELSNDAAHVRGHYRSHAD